MVNDRKKDVVEPLPVVSWSGSRNADEVMLPNTVAIPYAK